MWADNPSERGVEKVRSLQKKMLDSGVRLDDVVYGTLTKAYLRARRPAEAEAVLSEMHAAKLKPGVVVWTSVIAAWVNASEMDQVRRWWREGGGGRALLFVPPNISSAEPVVRTRAGKLRDGRRVALVCRRADARLVSSGE